MDVLNPNAEQYTHDARRHSTEGISVSHRGTESTEIHREIRIDFFPANCPSKLSGCIRIRRASGAEGVFCAPHTVGFSNPRLPILHHSVVSRHPSGVRDNGATPIIKAPYKSSVSPCLCVFIKMWQGGDSATGMGGLINTGTERVCVYTFNIERELLGIVGLAAVIH